MRNQGVVLWGRIHEKTQEAKYLFKIILTHFKFSLKMNILKHKKKFELKNSSNKYILFLYIVVNCVLPMPSYISCTANVA